ncbi:hypothetical protein HDV00_007559 [Rhizophlyctis rosea]|nr:hypothetical protein HDV00_007559 [Rhizophlyctis rosea]
MRRVASKKCNKCRTWVCRLCWAEEEGGDDSEPCRRGERREEWAERMEMFRRFQQAVSADHGFDDDIPELVDISDMPELVHNSVEVVVPDPVHKPEEVVGPKLVRNTEEIVGR